MLARYHVRALLFGLTAGLFFATPVPTVLGQKGDPNALADAADDNAEKGRGDEPKAWSSYWAKLHAGNEEQIPLDALPKAIARVREMRNRVAREANVPPFAAALLANRGGAVRRVAGIPVGPLPASAPAGVAIPELREIPALPEAERGQIERRLLPQSVPLSAHINPTDWVWLGPGNIGGRMRSLVVHPTNPQTMWLGGVAGGVWRTTDAGVTWAPSHDFMASLVISCMAMDPTDPDTIYVGTGEGFFNADAFRGFGVFQSKDGGLSWNQLPATAINEFRWVNRISISADGKTILAATRDGLFRSDDDGVTFDAVNVPVASSFVLRKDELLDVRFHPTDKQKCITAGRGGQVFHSADGGLTWAAADRSAAPLALPPVKDIVD